MSYAWESSDEDVRTVCAAHGRHDPAALDAATTASRDASARVEQAALRYTDLDDQTASALDEIETILIEAGTLTGPKRFTAP